MAMVVKNNMSAVNTLNTLNRNQSALGKSLQKVSSGLKINSAQDDASGYGISERMRTMIRSLDQAKENTQNGSSLMKVAEGAVGKTVEILRTLKNKAIQAATDTNTDDDRKTIQKEIDQLIDQVDDNALVTFNGKYLLDGSKTLTGIATNATMTNQKLGEEVYGGTRLINLTNRKGESLQINKTDKVTASYVKNGQTYTTVYEVGNSTLEDIFYNLNTEDGGTVFGAAQLSAKTADATAVNIEIKNLYNLLTSTDKDPYSQTLKKVATLAENATIQTPASFQAAPNNDLAQTLNSVTANNIAAFTKLSHVWDVLEYDFDSTVGAASTTTATTASVMMTYYNVDGSSETKTYDFGTIQSGVAISDSTKHEVYAQLKDDAMRSFENLISNILEQNTDTNAYAAYGANLITNVATNGASGSDTAAIAVDLWKATGGALTYTNLTATAFADTGKGGENYLSANLMSQVGIVAKGEQVGTGASKNAVKTADGTVGLTVTALNSGFDGAISGVAISIADSEGQTRKNINEYLDAFTATIFATNKSEDTALALHTGAQAGQSITVGLEDMRAVALGLKGEDNTKVSVVTQHKANAAISVFDNALQKALDIQTTIGAIEARLVYTSDNLTTASENVQAAESTIRDADMAKEMTNYTKNNVLLQAAQSMLAQANQNSSAVLSLLQ